MELLSILLVFGLSSLCCGCCLCLCLVGEPFGNTALDSVYRAVCIRPMTLAKTAVQWGLGKKWFGKLERLYHYIVYTNNPLIQILYVVLVGGGYLLFTITAYPYIPGPFLGGWHRVTAFLASAVCLVCFIVCSLRDPGVVHGHNVEPLSKAYDFDGLMFAPGVKCKTCRLPKPARSKHCSLCNQCVARFDHHCIWIGNCVGANNHSHFLLFLLLNANMCLYGTYLCIYIIWGVIESNRLFEVTFVEAVTQKKFHATTSLVFTYLVGRHSVLAGLLLLCGVFAIILYAFFVWHFYMAFVSNMTTNESFKHRVIRADLSPDEIARHPKYFSNIHSRGFWKNAREIVLWQQWLDERSGVGRERGQQTTEGNETGSGGEGGTRECREGSGGRSVGGNGEGDGGGKDGGRGEVTELKSSAGREIAVANRGSGRGTTTSRRRRKC